MKHKHCELIKAWADGAKVQYWHTVMEEWFDFDNPSWCENGKYRIKPEPKPDVVLHTVVGEYQEHHYHYEGFAQITDGFRKENFGKAKPNLKLTFDGETGKLKSAEVLK